MRALPILTVFSSASATLDICNTVNGDYRKNTSEP